MLMSFKADNNGNSYKQLIENRKMMVFLSERHRLKIILKIEDYTCT